MKRSAPFLILLALLSGVVACSSDASTRSGAADAGPTTTAAPVTVPTSVPAGTTLRVGDQLDYLKTVLHLAHQDEDLPYKVAYSAFVGGPAMLQAFQAGAIDTGFVASTPLIFAQAGGQPIRAVAGWASEHGSYGLLTAPGHDDIKGWADLKGKRVAFQQGTAGEAALLQALDDVGLKLSDVKAVNLPQTQITAALQGGSADAGLSVEPLTSVYLGQNPTAEKVEKTSEITDRSFFVIASDPTLHDEAKTAALADYVGRLVRSFVYLQKHPDLVAQAVYVQTYHLPADRAADIVKENGTTGFITLPGPLARQQQRLADLFQANGEIPQKLDTSQEFDTRFNHLVQQEATS
ncbi:MAG: ABC transporter substrate-binding protein [Acidimicrobiia bacterium]|nr:ABC transporter substrate-binding protein [Acidimicrobiia bacterium]